MKIKTLIATLVIGLGAGSAALAADWPLDKPIRVLVGYAPGGPTDTQARMLADAIQGETGVTTIVENMPGGSGTIAIRQLLSAPADGHTLLYTIDGPLTQLPHTMGDLGYKPLEELVPVTRTSLGGSVLLVHSSVPADDLPSFLKWAQDNPGKLSYASYGIGTLAHIYGAVLSDKFKLDMTHVPYKGSSEAMRDLVAGRVDVMFDSPTTSLAFVEQGHLKRLAATGDTRRPLLPELQTLKEQGVEGFEVRSFNGFYAPQGLEPEVREQINEVIHRAARNERVQQVWETQGFEHIYESPADFDKAYQHAYQQWGEYIQQLGLAIN